MQTLPFSESPFFTEDLILDGTTYRLSFLWNTRAARWSLSLFDASAQALVEGIAVVLDQELLEQYPTQGLPPGQLYAVDASGQLQTIGRDDFTLERVSLVYVPEEEV